MKIKKADVVELLEDVGNTVHYFKKGDIGVVIDDDYDSCLEVSFKEGKLIAEKDVFKRIIIKTVSADRASFFHTKWS